MRAFVMTGIVCSMAAAASLQEDAPVTSRPTSGTLSGVLRTEGPESTRPPEIEPGSLRVVSRVTGLSYSPSGYDAATGRFRFTDLPGDARYDVCFRTAGGRDEIGRAHV